MPVGFICVSLVLIYVIFLRFSCLLSPVSSPSSIVLPKVEIFGRHLGLRGALISIELERILRGICRLAGWDSILSRFSSSVAVSCGWHVCVAFLGEISLKVQRYLGPHCVTFLFELSFSEFLVVLGIEKVGFSFCQIYCGLLIARVLPRGGLLCHYLTTQVSEALSLLKFDTISSVP